MAGCNQVWYHKNLGRMETEKLLMESKEDGSFLVRESDTVKGAYVLSTIYQHRIHHYRILPNEEGKLSIQAQQGVQRKQFSQIEDLVEYYRHARRGLVCALSIPIAQKKEEEEEEEQPDDPDDSDDEAETGREKNIVSKFLLASLSTVDTAKVEESFLDQVRTYLEKDVSQDIETMTTPTPHLRQLKLLFHKDCMLLHKQLNKIMAELDLLKSLFDRAGGAKHGSTVVTSSKNRRSNDTDMDYDTLSYKLDDCAKSVTGLETTAFQMLRELSMSMTQSMVSRSQQQFPPLTNGPMKTESLPREDSEEMEFECKLDQGLQGKKNVNILVNLRTCKFHFYKPGDELPLQKQYEHHQLLQLVKSRTKDTRLTIVLEGQGKKEYLFSDMRSRERFCQLTQLIRNRMRAGKEQDEDSVSVFVGSWNMGDAGPPPEINSWVQSAGWGKTLPTALSQAHDLYAFGTQETNVTEKEWIAKMRQTLKQLYDIDYDKVVCSSLWGMRCLILAKPEHMNKIAHVQTSSVKTGIGNTLGNKGGVGVSFLFGSISLCFICTHLTSGNEKCHRRNQNYHDILKGMGNLKQKKLNQFDLTNQFNHLFFFGDLNYRVDMKATDIVEYAKNFDHHAIFMEDQLRKEKEKKTVLVGFDEETILFPPTYRFNRGARTMDDYVWVKNKRSGIRINVPSYCDRVLWRSYPGMRIINTSYGCTNDIMTSDHSPIFTTFQLHGIKEFVPDSGVSKNKNALIIIDSCNAKIATSSRTNFYIEFFSECAEGMTRTPPNNDWRHVSGEADAWPVWQSSEPVTSIRPIITEEAYLEQQHLLVMLKSQEGDEPYAECCLCLRDAIGREPKKMESDLIHQGHHVGVLEIKIHVKLDKYREKKVEEELYSDVNFITQDDAMTTLDKPGVTRSQVRTPSNSESSDVINTRPMQPIPRTNSQSGSEHHRLGHTVSQPPVSSTLPPPPLPSRRVRETFNPAHSNSAPRLHTASTSATMRPSVESSPPQVPVRRTERSSNRQPEIIDRSLDSAGFRSAMTTVPPATARRKPSPGHSNPVPSHSSRSAKDALPSLPNPGLQGPPVPSRRGGARSPRPAVTSINSLLISHGLQQYVSVLQSNGYDHPRFLPESDKELQDIGVVVPSDREKLLRLFKSVAQSH